MDDTLKFDKEKSVKHNYELTKQDIKHREVHIAIPQGTSKEKMTAIQNAIHYGKNNGVKVIITETKPK